MENTDFATTRIAKLVIIVLLIGLSGCFAPTPGERISQLKGKVVQRGDGVIDLDLSKTPLSDKDFVYVNAFCSNDRRYKEIHTLNLAHTLITDEFLRSMTLQSGRFVTDSGLHELILTGTKTSDAAIQDYRAVDPDCRIVR